MKEKAPSAKEVLIKGSLIHNPVLIQCAGLCPVIAAATSLKNAAILAAAVSVITVITCIIASAFLKKAPRWFRVALYLVIGIAVICPVLSLIEVKTPLKLSLSMEIYLPLMAVNSVTAVHCEQFSVKNSVRLAFYDAAAVAIGSSAVLLLCGALREISGSSSIAGIPLNLPLTFKSSLMPSGALLILGFLAALLKVITAAVYPEFIPESDSIVKRKPKNGEGETVEVEIFDEFWNTSEPAEIKLDEYDEVFNSLDDIFNYGIEEDERQ